MERIVSGTRDLLTIQVDDAIELRRVSVADCGELYAAIDRNRSRLRTWLPWVTDTFQWNDLIEFIRQRQKDNAAGVSLTMNIFFEGRLCGAIGLHAINVKDRNTSIGY
jgi:ribosomal-protein-serine acetyltransferase